MVAFSGTFVNSVFRLSSQDRSPKALRCRRRLLMAKRKWHRMQLRWRQPLRQVVSAFPANWPCRGKAGREWQCQPHRMLPWQPSKLKWAVA